MRYLIIPLAVCFMIGFAGCKKKSSGEPACYVTQLMYPGIDTTFITYDSQNRILSYGNPRSYLVNFSYSGITATSTSIYADSAHPFLNLFFSTGGEIESMDYSSTVGTETHRITYSFKYDSEGRMFRCEQTSTKVGMSFNPYLYELDSMVYENGNMAHIYKFKKTAEADPYVLNQRVDISYSADKNKLGYFAVRSEDSPIGWGSDMLYLYYMLGKGSVNLPSVSKTYNSAGTEIDELEYTFVLNSNGFPEEVNRHELLGTPFTENLRYDYKCQ